MARVGRAARGKRRWIGVKVVAGLERRSDVEAAMKGIPALSRARLFDFVSAAVDADRTADTRSESPAGSISPAADDGALEQSGRAILLVPLADYAAARDALTSGEHALLSVTSSGKIRLVRERLGLPRRRKRR